MERLSEQRCFGGVQGVYRHASSACAAPMRFSVYQPPQAAQHEVPVLYFLAGLTCNEETFMIKAGAQRVAAELGLMLVAPDTSPRDTGIDGATGDWEFGEGAGFYLDAEQAPYARNFRMYSYVASELPALIERHFPADLSRSGIFGHSMGGHGALTIALKHADRYRSVSAFAPIVAPSRVPWGDKAFTRYLGTYRQSWAEYDATELVRRQRFHLGRHPDELPRRGGTHARRPGREAAETDGLPGDYPFQAGVPPRAGARRQVRPVAIESPKCPG